MMKESMMMKYDKQYLKELNEKNIKAVVLMLQEMLFTFSCKCRKKDLSVKYFTV